MKNETTAATSTILVRGPGEGPATWALGGLFERLASGAETADAFALSLVTQPVGTATPLHVHTREAEAFYLLDGNLTYRADDELHRLGSGSFIYLPSGVPHAFRVTGTEPVRYLAISAPGALMDLYHEMGRPAAVRQLPEPDDEVLTADIHQWLTASPGYGLSVVGPPIPADA
ncbi:MAG: cupin domain-containing protein [Actinomycetota bacterium]